MALLLKWVGGDLSKQSRTYYMSPKGQMKRVGENLNSWHKASQVRFKKNQLDLFNSNIFILIRWSKQNENLWKK